jgi:hypothetical protein
VQRHLAPVSGGLKKRLVQSGNDVASEIGVRRVAYHADDLTGPLRGRDVHQARLPYRRSTAIELARERLVHDGHRR